MSNSQTTLRCRVRKTTEGFEGTVYMPGTKPTKLVKKDETCIYANKSGVASAAKSFADRHGYTLELEDTTATSVKTKKAVKKDTSEVF